MSLPVFLALAAAGGVGAAARFMVDGVIRARFVTAYPWATTVINVTGSFLLGLLTALVTRSLVSSEWSLVLGTGFLGGYTTFSTASYETVRLVRERRYAAALGSGLGMLAGCVAAAALGYWVGGS
ncbi:fluoride efflux transporter CrcB [Specibacter cremeus]|uniref:fluoride efflux transporter CrcB n=1 Tax=Specibacter cremeus TaxID=1629051 RepID=UPI000F76B949|nr:fluoride efflux transporter CrcB [Specibacter cremeus]